MSHRLHQHLLQQHRGIPTGIYSVCSAHPWVVRAAAEQAVEDGSLLLIEATSNQVNQFGGYTGMRPADFRSFVLKHAAEAGLDHSRLILGGDHLGPNPWRSMPAAEAMTRAETMVAEYVAAGYTKIHLDASMACADDATHPSDEIVAERAARLCRVAEAAYVSGDSPIYVIGTEVPVPGGATHAVHELAATSTEAAAQTLAVHKRIFEQQVPGVWDRVIALVVQPGVEFDHDAVIDYEPAKAAQLSAWLRAQPEPIVFEAHSTDYQLPDAYTALVRDGFAILKVGPGLTFAMREALDALEDIEAQLVEEPRRSKLSMVLETAMLREPENWLPYYTGSAAHQALLRRYSYSDRVRYYWAKPEVNKAVDQLISNLAATTIPESMLSRYLPAQYLRMREGKISADPASLIVDRIRDVLRNYAAACRPV
ncbi:D-tagatose-bisphosphate aldolase, class II, non-catalytic subunit [Granulicella sp. L60]|uniref:D-tagatose-bisphosphate aldolase, class II, non-catalytic subunit n=1 Tax=Granulicella sp. L60 TaxID=1641866 RepID=UPI00131D92F7|nr:D-tagatose-bisphosphate aldolase, class II, non-catalytic subunit [Granulicella sp. L60]